MTPPVAEMERMDSEIKTDQISTSQLKMRSPDGAQAKILTPIEQLRENISSDPSKFAEKLFGVRLWPKQCEIVSSVFKHKRVAVRGCVASTKTFAASVTAMAWMIAHPQTGRVFHLAPSFRQVATNLWGYLKQLDVKATENRTPLGAKMFSEPRMEFGPGWGYHGFSTREPDAVHGIHGPDDLVILDDAHGIPKEITDELENMFAGGNTHCLMLFNPVILSGETFECSNKHASLWHNIVVGFSDLQKAYADGYQMSGSLQEDTVKTWAVKYGVKSNFYVSKVLGQYPTQAADSLIPMDWIELAFDREVPVGGKKVVGCDVAYTGSDSSIIAPMEGLRIHELQEFNGIDPMELADKLDIHLIDRNTSGWVDAIGLGAGVFAREKQRDRNVNSFVASEAAVGMYEGKVASEHFQNLRAQAAWMLREALNPKNPNAIALPRDQELQAQLSAITYKINPTTGKLQLQSKDEMRKEYGWSPDKFDAVKMAVFGSSGVGQEIPWSAWI